jgi:putative ATPase
MPRPPGSSSGPKNPGSALLPEPLAARMRPRTLDEFLGHEQLLGPGTPLRTEIESGTVGSMLFWGPPGSGKTTLGRLVAQYTDREFVPFSAVTEGVPRVRVIVGEAEARRAEWRGTVLFVDEIHRFNRTLTLIGATTENPSFEINGALLSRLRVFVLAPLAVADLAAMVRTALSDADRGLGALHLTIEDAALDQITTEADGDARRALTSLEAAASFVTRQRRGAAGGVITAAAVRDAMQARVARYDKSGEEHYNLISAYHKALRGSDPQGALYWLARMIEGGEDPMYIARRTVRFAAEDVGLADPTALRVALDARDTYHFLGSPEGELALAEAAVYLATAPKSNSVYRAWGAALDLARRTPAEGVPLHIRNAPTKLMKDLGYGRGYQYAHNVPEAYIPQDYLPDAAAGSTLYEPGPFGFEKEIAKRLAWWSDLRAKSERGRAPGGDAGAAPQPDPPRTEQPKTDEPTRDQTDG